MSSMSLPNIGRDVSLGECFLHLRIGQEGDQTGQLFGRQYDLAAQLVLLHRDHDVGLFPQVRGDLHRVDRRVVFAVGQIGAIFAANAVHLVADHTALLRKDVLAHHRILSAQALSRPHCPGLARP